MKFGLHFCFPSVFMREKTIPVQSYYSAVKKCPGTLEALVMRKHLFSGPPQATKIKRSSDPLSYQPPSEMLFHNIPREKIASTLCTLSDMIQSQQPLIFSLSQHTSAVLRWLQTWGTAPLYCKTWWSTEDPTDIARHPQKAQQKLNSSTSAIQGLIT